MKKLQSNEMAKIQGGRFWGTSCDSGTADIFNAYTGGFDTVSYTYCCSYVFWINTGCGYV